MSTAATKPAPNKPSRNEWVQSFIQKLIKSVQTDDNRKMIQVFLVDPVLNYILERLFPYVAVLCVLFVVLTVMISATLVIVFTRVGNVQLTAVTQ